MHLPFESSIYQAVSERSISPETIHVYGTPPPYHIIDNCGGSALRTNFVVVWRIFYYCTPELVTQRKLASVSFNVQFALV
uniref:Uncharacterized protein n=1 Tax=Ascaris lumbricoides TaxID=6252 RepID=A0A0M3HN71_ASCLU